MIVPSYITSELVQALWRNGASQARQCNFCCDVCFCVTGAICGKEDVKVTLYDNAPAPHGWPDYFGHASTIPAYVSWQDIVVTSVSGQWSVMFWHVQLACSWLAVAGPWSLAGRNRSLRVAVAAAAACGTALSMPGHGIHTASREILS